MPDLDTISADYSLRPSELADTLALLVEVCQPAIVLGTAQARDGPGRPDFRYSGAFDSFGTERARGCE